MKKIFFIMLWNLFLLNNVFADWGIIWGDWITAEKLRKWDIHTEDIPVAIKNAIDFGIWIAWTIAIIFIIIWAYKILFGSLKQDTTDWKNTIIYAISWLVIASLAWVIIKLILDNFS